MGRSYHHEEGRRWLTMGIEQKSWFLQFIENMLHDEACASRPDVGGRT